MDRYEYNIILEKLNKLVEEEDYTAALGLVEEVDWKRVRNTRTLIMVSEVYEKNQLLENAKDILLLAYERTTVGRSILYRLVEVAISMDNPDEALEYYMEYSLLYPNEPAKYILKYKVWRARGSSLEEQIQALETYKEQEYNEKWIFELAQLYEENKQEEKALALCDEIILWFADGEYVQKSMNLKRKYTALTPEEEMKYRQAVVKEQLSGDNFLDDACDPDEVEPIEGRVVNRQDGLPTAADIEDADTMEEALEIPMDIVVEDKVPVESNHLVEEPKEVAAEEKDIKEKSIIDILNEHAQKEALPKASSIELQLEDGILETIQETKEKQAQLEENIRKNREELSEAISMEEIEALVEESEAKKKEERIANSNPLEYEEEPIEQIQQEVSDELDELANLLKVEKIEDEGKKVIDLDINGEASADLEDYIPGQLSFDKLLAEMNQKEATSSVLQEVQGELSLSVNELFESSDIISETLPLEEEEIEEKIEEDIETASEEDILDIDLGLEGFLQTISEIDESEEDKEEATSSEDVFVEMDKPSSEEAVETDSMTEEEVLPEISDSFLEDIADIVQEEEKEKIADIKDNEEVAQEETEEELPVILDVDAIAEIAGEEATKEELDEELPILSGVDVFNSIPDSLDIKIDEEDEKSTESEELDLGLGLEDFLDGLMKEEKASKQEDELSQEVSIEDKAFPEDDEKALEVQVEDDELQDIAKELTLNLDELLKDESKDSIKTESVEEFDFSSALVGEVEHILEEDRKEAPISTTDTIVLEPIQEEVIEESSPKDPLTIEEVLPLTEEQKRMLTYFAPIPGITDQVSQVLAEVRRKGYDEKTSRLGNIIVMGRQGSGKTTLATNVLKAIEKGKGKDTFRIANISAKDLNEMDVAEVIEKIGGGGLIIEEARLLSDTTIQALSLAMDMRTDGLTVILEDDKRNMKAVLSEHQDFASKFTSQIVIPVFTNDELIEFAKLYADENGYAIDEMGILALYNKIGLTQREDKPVSVADVKEMVDHAIEIAESKVFGLFCDLFQKKDKEDKKDVLLEKHFEK